MAYVDLKKLVDRLNSICNRALQAAAGLCVSRTNYNVELEHLLVKLLEPDDSDLIPILRHYDVDKGKVNRELTRALDQLKTGNARSPEISLDVIDAIQSAWVLASVQYGSGKIRSSHLLAAVLNDRALSQRLQQSSAELAKINASQLIQDAPALTRGTTEDKFEPGDFQTAAPSGAGGPQTRPDSKTPSLDQFTLDLTERARQGEIAPVIGRASEIRQVIDILTRRRQNNPILTGEAGVGKTAVVEGFALAVVAGDVPPPLRNVVVRTLDLGLLEAGAGVKGEFENRLKSVINEVKASPQPIILFIDEAHTLIGAGGQAGQGDAANLLKPALARGELRTIAATTWNEYKKYFETDAALKRRFQVVKVDEPDRDKAIRMMRAISHVMQKHHKVDLLEEALEDSVKLSQRYITDRQLPDKSVSLLDTACARVALSQSAKPALVQDCERDIAAIQTEMAILEREAAVGSENSERMQELRDQESKAKQRLEELNKRWEKEQELTATIKDLRRKLEDNVKDDGSSSLASDDESKTRQELLDREKELETLQGEQPLVLPYVSGQAIAEVVSSWTGIPVGKMVRDEIKTILQLKQRMEERIIGQSHALEAIAERIRTSRANLTDPRRPIGVFMLVGPSGVGKTETAIALADILFGGDHNMVVINMSEYKEEQQISRLTGSAPGLVGYGEGGVLTEAVRRKPYSIVLLDEVEKANESVQEIFYQVFDKGMLQDDRGNQVDFKNTIILMTSNAGTDTIMKVCADPDTRPEPEGLNEALRPDLLKVFKPALLGRINIIPYYPLTDEVLKLIIKLQIKRVSDRLYENHRATLDYDDKLIDTIASRCTEVESGARNVDHILTGTLLPELSGQILARMVQGETFAKARVGVDAEGNFVYEVN